jgi:hypothetical protein
MMIESRKLEVLDVISFDEKVGEQVTFGFMGDITNSYS